MSDMGLNWPISKKPDRFGGPIYRASDGGSVGKEERKQRVLAFLVDCRLALPRLALYRNLSYQGADFSDGSLKNYLAELRQDGYVERIDAEAFAEGRVEISDDDPGYWLATVEGRNYITSIRADQRDEIDTSHL